MDIDTEHPHEIKDIMKNLKIDKSCMICVMALINEVRKIEMNYEKFRLQSFMNWPLPYIGEKECAEEGFYYVGLGDRVICNFCDLAIHEFNAGDNIGLMHKKWSPYCKGKESNNNIILK